MTKIEWTEHTWNVASGCTKVSDGCLNCYIERTPPFRMAHRKFDKPGIGGKTGVVLHPDRLTQPLHWRKPRMVFVNSLTDLFHDDIPTEFIARTFAAIARAPQHTFQLLTKRHGRMHSLIGNEITGPQALMEAATDEDTAQALYDSIWPLPNLWLGVSVENQKWLEIRLGSLLATSAAVRFLSCEPLVGGVNLQPDDHTGHDFDYDGGPTHDSFRCLTCSGDDDHVWWGTQEFPEGLSWVIAGGESGPGSRPMRPDWARSLRDQCEKASVPFFFKQWGEYAQVTDKPKHGDIWVAPDGSTRLWDYGGGRTKTRLGEWRTGPQGAESALVRRVGKKAAGRELDGREWSEFPRAVTG